MNYVIFIALIIVVVIAARVILNNIKKQQSEQKHKSGFSHAKRNVRGGFRKKK